MDNQRKHLEIVPTEDGTPTLYNAYFDECCHSTSGAYQETLTHYFHGCGVIIALDKNQTTNILEVGFGSGMGLKVTLENLPSQDLSKTIHFVSLELDIESCRWALVNTTIHNKPLSDILKIDGDKIYGNYQNVTITVLVGDARASLPAFMNQQDFKFHCIYQDAFSPKKNPQLWTVEWFKFLKSIANSDAILSTYSSSLSIRKSLDLAGWTIYEGDRFGKKRSSTRAKLTDKTSADILLQLNRSPATAIFETDEKLKETLHVDE